MSPCPALVGGFFAALTILTPRPAEAQFHLGAHLAGTSFQEGGFGGGVRLGLDIPVLPIDVAAVGDFPTVDCSTGNDGCSFWGGSADVNLRMPIPVIRPYATGGLSYRKGQIDAESETETETGLNFGVGLDINLGVRIFADWRYEFLSTFEGSVIRAGLLIDL